MVDWDVGIGAGRRRSEKRKERVGEDFIFDRERDF